MTITPKVSLGLQTIAVCGWSISMGPTSSIVQPKSLKKLQKFQQTFKLLPISMILQMPSLIQTSVDGNIGLKLGKLRSLRRKTVSYLYGAGQGGENSLVGDYPLAPAWLFLGCWLLSVRYRCCLLFSICICFKQRRTLFWFCWVVLSEFSLVSSFL